MENNLTLKIDRVFELLLKFRERTNDRPVVLSQYGDLAAEATEYGLLVSEVFDTASFTIEWDWILAAFLLIKERETSNHGRRD